MDSYIFNPNTKSHQTEIAQPKYYCLVGNEDFIDPEGLPRKTKDCIDVLAKCITRDGGQPQYYIKLANTNKLYNPINIFTGEKASSFLDNVCRPTDRFKSVNQKVFTMYTQFLSSKNILWLHKAERETI
jgi:hypothetical protein